MLHGVLKLKVIVIDPDLKRIVKSGQKLTLILKSFSDHKHFTIPDLIIALGFFKQRGPEGDRMPERVYIIALLRDDPTGGIF
jgi:hypothetical protein